MPHKEQLQFIQLHPNFAAEVRGVDFSTPLPDDVFATIQSAVAKVGIMSTSPAGLFQPRLASRLLNAKLRGYSTAFSSSAAQRWTTPAMSPSPPASVIWTTWART